MRLTSPTIPSEPPRGTFSRASRHRPLPSLERRWTDIGGRSAATSVQAGRGAGRGRRRSGPGGDDDDRVLSRDELQVERLSGSAMVRIPSVFGSITATASAVLESAKTKLAEHLRLLERLRLLLGRQRHLHALLRLTTSPCGQSLSRKQPAGVAAPASVPPFGLADAPPSDEALPRMAIRKDMPAPAHAIGPPKRMRNIES